MLGKLLKYEMKAVVKPMVFLNALVIFSTLIGFFYVMKVDVGNIVENENDIRYSGMMLLGFLYIAGVALTYFISYILLLLRYGKSMYGANGYLSWTLPVKRRTLIHAKMLNGILWNFWNTALCFACVIWLIALFMTKAGINMGELFREIPPVILHHFMLPTVAIVCINVFTVIFIGYFCITVGQLMKEHKVLGTIVSFVGVYIVQQVATTVVMLAGGFFSFMNDPNFQTIMNSGELKYTFWKFYDSLFLGQIIILLVFAAVTYTCCHLIPRKRINLD